MKTLKNDCIKEMLQYGLTKCVAITILYRIMFISKPNFILIIVLYVVD